MELLGALLSFGCALDNAAFQILVKRLKFHLSPDTPGDVTPI